MKPPADEQSARRRPVWRWVSGMALALSGYLLLAIPPQTSLSWVLVRLVAGFALLFAGFLLVIWPIIATQLADHD